MKKNILLLLLLSTITLSFTLITTNKEDKKKFIGSWSGSEIDNQKKGLTKYWIQHRFKNGTYVILFTYIIDCEVQSFSEKGKWWLKDGLFYEKNSEASKKTDAYSYEFLDDNPIKFKASKLESDVENKEYEFIDTRVADLEE